MDRDPIRGVRQTALAVVTVDRSRGRGPGPVARLRPRRGRAARCGWSSADTGRRTAHRCATASRSLRIGEDVGRAAAANRGRRRARRTPWAGWRSPIPRVRVVPAGALDVLLAAAARRPRAAALGPPAARRPDRAALPSAGDAAAARRDAAAGAHARARAARRRARWAGCPASCVLLRRAAWDSVDGFDPRYGTRGPSTSPMSISATGSAGPAGCCVHVPSAEVGRCRNRAQGILEPPAAGLRRYLRRPRRHADARRCVALAGPPPVTR